MTRSTTTTLSDEDRILWNLVARTTTPLKGRSHEALPEPAPVPSAEPEKPVPLPAGLPVAAAERRNSTLQAALDRQTHDKLSGGRLAIEARVDLHGMTQQQAHGLLLSFLARAHTAGLRYVLVITGKGSSSGGDGVLRRAVPHWLATPPFRAFVSGLDTASRIHGGSGALYVRLRRRAPG